MKDSESIPIMCGAVIQPRRGQIVRNNSDLEIILNSGKVIAKGKFVDAIVEWVEQPFLWGRLETSTLKLHIDNQTVNFKPAYDQGKSRLASNSWVIAILLVGFGLVGASLAFLGWGKLYLLMDIFLLVVIVRIVMNLEKKQLKKTSSYLALMKLFGDKIK